MVLVDPDLGCRCLQSGARKCAKDRQKSRFEALGAAFAVALPQDICVEVSLTGLECIKGALHAPTGRTSPFPRSFLCAVDIQITACLAREFAGIVVALLEMTVSGRRDPSSAMIVGHTLTLRARQASHAARARRLTLALSAAEQYPEAIRYHCPTMGVKDEGESPAKQEKHRINREAQQK